jgi:hypothetical protein
MPHVEVWYPEPIPVSAIQKCTLVVPSNPIQCIDIDSMDKRLKEVDELLGSEQMQSHQKDG